MKRIFYLLILAAGFMFMSCNVDLNLALKKDGSVDISFTGSAGKAFSKMILSATGGDEVFDTKEFGYELAKAGFSNISVKNVPGKTKGTDLSISMSDLKKTSYLFTSGVVREEKGKLIANVSAETLKHFYDSADEQTQMVLDLFLAPVFNEEQMSEAEYIEMLGTIYGADAANEVRESVINISISDGDGGKRSKKLFFSQLMCGVEGLSDF